MSRIRSIHPSIWTDSDFINVSMPAGQLFIGLWNFADDAGVFEWHPQALKIKILPTRRININNLLLELETRGMVESYEVEGKRYGQIRDFTQWQHPKKPVYKYPKRGDVAGLKKPKSDETKARLTQESSRTEDRLMLDWGGTDARLAQDYPENTNKINNLQKKVPPVEKRRVEKSISISTNVDISANAIDPPANIIKLPDKPIPIQAVLEPSPSVDPASTPPRASDPHKVALFSQGLRQMQAMQVPVQRIRPLLGKWLKSLHNDAKELNAIIDTAYAMQVADPISFIQKCVLNRTKKINTLSQITSDWGLPESPEAIDREAQRLISLQAAREVA